METESQKTDIRRHQQQGRVRDRDIRHVIPPAMHHRALRDSRGDSFRHRIDSDNPMAFGIQHSFRSPHDSHNFGGIHRLHYRGERLGMEGKKHPLSPPCCRGNNALARGGNAFRFDFLEKIRNSYLENLFNG